MPISTYEGWVARSTIASPTPSACWPITPGRSAWTYWTTRATYPASPARIPLIRARTTVRAASIIRNTSNLSLVATSNFHFSNRLESLSPEQLGVRRDVEHPYRSAFNVTSGADNSLTGSEQRSRHHRPRRSDLSKGPVPQRRRPRQPRISQPGSFRSAPTNTNHVLLCRPWDTATDTTPVVMENQP